MNLLVRFFGIPRFVLLPFVRTAFIFVLLGSAVSANAQWLPSPWTSGPIHFTGGNVGIGTTDTTLANSCDAGLIIQGESPALRLHSVSGDLPAGGTPFCGDYQLATGPFDNGVEFMIFNVCAGLPRLTIDGNGAVAVNALTTNALNVGGLVVSGGGLETHGGPLAFGMKTGGGTGVEIENIWMTIATTGKVGIGTSAPLHLLDVSGTPSVNGGANELLGIYDTRNFAAGVGGGIAFGGKINATGTTAQNFASIQGIKENATSGDTASAMLFFTHLNAATPVERMRIGSDGLVTVGAVGGTGMKLAVNGSIRSFSGGFQFPDGTVQATAAVSGPWAAGTSNAIYYSAGNVGIGTTTPAFPLAVNGVVQSLAGGFKFPDGTTQASAAINSQWGQSGSSVYYSGGNVGIGTNAPLTPLAVNGVVHSMAGGFKFPDGTTQSTAAGQGTSFWAAGTPANSIFYSGGNVGVGTNNPGGPLNVVAGGGLNSLFTATGSDGFIRVNSTVASHPYADFILSGTASTAYGEIRVGDDNSWRNLVLLGNGGAVGVGTTSPTAALHVKSTANTNGAARRTIVAYDAAPSAAGVGGGIAFGGNYAAATSTPPTDFANIWAIKEFATDNDNSGVLLFGTASNGASAERMRISSTGLVTIAPTGTTGTRLKVNGDIDVTGNINAKYQDMAEWVPAAEMLPPGTVVVLNPSVSNQVMSSTEAYATTVAGVVSEHPGILLGERGASKVQVATTGRVKVKVDATKGAVHIGDLLVTSDEPGTAMKSQPIDVGGMKIHRPGTLIGKALEPLAGGQGEILVLLSLQ